MGGTLTLAQTAAGLGVGDPQESLSPAGAGLRGTARLVWSQPCVVPHAPLAAGQPPPTRRNGGACGQLPLSAAVTPGLAFV